MTPNGAFWEEAKKSRQLDQMLGLGRKGIIWLAKGERCVYYCIFRKTQ